MKRIPFNPKDIAVMPHLSCRHCGVVVNVSITQYENGVIIGFVLKHPTNSCQHSGRETAAKVTTLASFLRGGAKPS